ncbi:hypothetical protein SDC9_119973 [bioreactor metagenome]|uniref:Uncharacterized protein n=1 Tax=bioreactor metagenome TaxID=1076179 RepID=A0A645C761_9ZZZZ
MIARAVQNPLEHGVQQDGTSDDQDDLKAWNDQVERVLHPVGQIGSPAKGHVGSAFSKISRVLKNVFTISTIALQRGAAEIVNTF